VWIDLIHMALWVCMALLVSTMQTFFFSRSQHTMLHCKNIGCTSGRAASVSIELRENIGNVLHITHLDVCAKCARAIQDEKAGLRNVSTSAHHIPRAGPRT